jgi:hypothetical protein
MSSRDPRSIPTGRSWRDLPPTPPDRLRAVEVAPSAPPAEPSARPSVLPWVAAGAVVVFLGFIFGLITQSPLESEESLGAPDAESLSTLPEEIVPPVPPELETPGTEQPPVQETEPLFRVPVVPEGFRQTQNLAQRSAGAVTQVAVLEGEVGEVVIEAQASDSGFEDPEGEPVAVRGTQGAVEDVEEGGLELSWVEGGRVLFRIAAPEGYPLEDVLELAESLEVS